MNFALDKMTVEILLAELVELDSAWNTMNVFPAWRISPQTRLYLPLKGKGVVKEGDHTFLLERGKMLLVPAFAPVFCSCDNYLQKYWICFNATLLESDVDIFFLHGGCIELDVSENLPVCQWLFKRIADHYSTFSNTVSQLARLEAQSALLFLLAPFLERTLAVRNEKKIPKLIELLLFIEKNISRQMTLKELGKIACLHPNYLSSLFKKNMSFSLVEYINRKRITHALQYLRDNELTMGEIAEKVGIANVQAFSKMFKKFYGISPRNFKKMPEAKRNRK